MIGARVADIIADTLVFKTHLPDGESAGLRRQQYVLLS
jgi:hypothetical protein